MKYNSEKIIWIKNVKKVDGGGWAYENEACKKNFLLHWSTAKGGSASTPNTGDIIVLFQKPKKVNNKNNKKVHLTHLVTPISNEVLIDDTYPKHKFCRLVKLIAKADPIYSIPNTGDFNFFKPNRGLTNPIINLESRSGLTEIEIKEELWGMFSDFFCKGIEIEEFKPNNPIGIFGEKEGDKIIRNHIQQEVTNRNSGMVQQAKKQAIIKGNGRIRCECCDFDFVEFYGEIGHGFIECHHKIPLSKGERITEIEDLALVCSNCHRMLHRKKSDDDYYKVKELQKIIKKSR